MAGIIHAFLSADHRRLDDLLAAATDAGIDVPAYQAFRAGLLRHIGMEEKVLLPAAKRLLGGTPPDSARQMRLDHGALVALLVPTPTPDLVAKLRALLELHNALEEDPGGLYDVCERATGAEAAAIVGAMEAAPQVPVVAHFDGERSRASIERLLALAGRLQPASPVGE